MAAEPSLISLVADAGVLVKIVMSLLLAASIASWALIFQRLRLYRSAKKQLVEFEDKFWSGVKLIDLFGQLLKREHELTGLEQIYGRSTARHACCKSARD